MDITMQVCDSKVLAINITYIKYTAKNGLGIILYLVVAYICMTPVCLVTLEYH